MLGSLSDLGAIVETYKIDEVIIAMPRAPGAVIREVLDAAAAAKVKTRTVPGMFDIISGRVAIRALRKVEIQDLLRREPVTTSLEAVRTIVAGHTVLVTGAGGSIGSELCRQLVDLGPERVILAGHGENSIFDILNELKASTPDVEFVPVIVDVRDRELLGQAFRQWTPIAVFHAAAHKHVPMMERNVAEAITNNILGTRNVVELAAEHGVERLVLISTDKAVHPTNVMGATKRVAEMVVQMAAREHGRNFVSVRFGNVLGSRGSVVPTFLRQIGNGGPVTVTHPEMRRYFMTIPESVQLVLQAGSLGKGGEVFVLDMGEPIKIADLAADLIRLSGKEVGTDIEIRFSGSRPGEKLFEELFFSAEQAAPTEHEKVLRATNARLEGDVAPKITAHHRGRPGGSARRGTPAAPDGTGAGLRSDAGRLAFRRHPAVAHRNSVALRRGRNCKRKRGMPEARETAGGADAPPIFRVLVFRVPASCPAWRPPGCAQSTSAPPAPGQLARLEQRGPLHLAMEVVGDELRRDGPLDGAHDQVRRLVPAQVAQHHLAGQDDRAGVHLVLAGVLRRGAVRRLEDGVARSGS